MRTMKSVMFKWNPFTLRGEAPASLRFKQAEGDLGELEFATKEDLEAIKADPKLSKIYQSMNAGVTKKFQGYSEEKRTLQQQVANLQQQVQELDSGLLEWENWFTANKDTLTKVLQSGGGGDGEEGKGRGKGKSKEQEPNEQYNQLAEAFQNAARSFESRLGHMGKMLQLSLELSDLYRKHPEMDGNKVLDIALKKRHRTLEDAFKDEDAYGKELFDKEVETRLKPRVEEEIQKRRTNVETGSGAVPMSFELPKEPAKSFTAAGAEFLAEREKGEAKP